MSDLYCFKGKCKCVHACIIVCNDGFEFIGCRHEPYKGRWITELRKCPKIRKKGAKV